MFAHQVPTSARTPQLATTQLTYAPATHACSAAPVSASRAPTASTAPVPSASPAPAAAHDSSPAQAIHARTAASALRTPTTHRRQTTRTDSRASASQAGRDPHAMTILTSVPPSRVRTMVSVSSSPLTPTHASVSSATPELTARL